MPRFPNHPPSPSLLLLSSSLSAAPARQSLLAHATRESNSLRDNQTLSWTATVTAVQPKEASAAPGSESLGTRLEGSLYCSLVQSLEKGSLCYLHVLGVASRQLQNMEVKAGRFKVPVRAFRGSADGTETPQLLYSRRPFIVLMNGDVLPPPWSWGKNTGKDRKQLLVTLARNVKHRRSTLSPKERCDIPKKCVRAVANHIYILGLNLN